MIYLGIDPGTHRIGYGIISLDGQRMLPLTYGVIENTGSDRAAHIRNTESSLDALIRKHRPDAAGIEKLFFTTNRKTAMSVSEMRGVLLATLGRHGLPIREFTPLQVKQAVCGYGKADKGQVQRIVRMLLKITEPIRPDDAADALAIAICCSAAPLSPPGA
ncbi:MAG TPA: crossover junction endodeoxyribonuclease RuvC [Candidatus Paceibacterota bacterium]|nr:crossover junction endodeoxyribonuclease RuvC [Candidatus Paceibacterota bacterium]